MTIDTRQYRSQIEAAYTLLSEDTTTFEKFEKIRLTIKGISPELDARLVDVRANLTRLRALWNTDIIHLSSHALPERTPEEKKRKKYLLLLITSWKSLKSEVKRVQGYSESQKDNASAKHTAATVAKTGLFAKGPFGLITGAAIVIVGAAALLKTFSPVIITIANEGCPPISPPTKLPVAIPGIKLPTEPIMSGSSGMATLPAITATVSTTTTSITGSVFGQSGTYRLPTNTVDVRFDEETLMNQTKKVKLSSRKSHNLTLICH